MNNDIDQLETEQNAIQNAYAYSRVSSGIQLKGTGIARQKGTPERICDEHGWSLSPQTFTDLGVSAHHGKNRLKGDLSIFIKLACEGKLLPNPVLILEQWDRFSRQELDESFQAVRELLRTGVAIYISYGNRVFTKAHLNSLGDRLQMEVALHAAWEYSQNLSKRMKSVWKSKKQRSTEANTPYKTKVPGWLKWNADKKCYDKVPAKVESVERAFELACLGIGVRGIAKRMNSEGTPVIGNYNGRKIKSKEWAPSTVVKLIRHRKVLGWNDNVQPPIQMYPAVIDEKMYYKANKKITERRTFKYYGQHSDKPQSLFSGLTECHSCHAPMNIHRQKPEVSPNTGSRGGRAEYVYLRCQGVINGVCKNSMLRYDRIEESFASMLSGSSFVAAYTDTKPEQANVADLIQGKIIDTHERLERYTSDYEKQPSNALLGLMSRTENEENELRQELEKAKAVTIGASPIGDMRNELLSTLYKGWNDLDVRLRLRELIRAVCERIVIDGPNRSYTIHWRNKDKPTVVEIFKRAYKIDGMLMMANPNWQADIVAAGEVIRQLEGQPKAEGTETEPIADRVVRHLGATSAPVMLNPVEPPTKAKRVKRTRKNKGLTPLPDKEPA